MRSPDCATAAAALGAGYVFPGPTCKVRPDVEGHASAVVAGGGAGVGGAGTGVGVGAAGADMLGPSDPPQAVTETANNSAVAAALEKRCDCSKPEPPIAPRVPGTGPRATYARGRKVSGVRGCVHHFIGRVQSDVAAAPRL